MDDRAHYKKLWLLATLNAIKVAGIGSIPSTFVHRLIYFTTALAVVSRQEPEIACVIKRATGPYFPDYAWELERLVGMGLVTTKGQIDDIDDLESHVVYKITKRGLETLWSVAENVSSLKDTIHHVGLCVRELAFSGVLQDPNSWEADPNQQSRKRAIGDLIDYGEIQPSSQVNYSAIEAAQLLGISTDAFTSEEEASEAVRKGIFWDKRETYTSSFIGLDKEFIPGLTITKLLPIHGPSLFARSLGIKRGSYSLRPFEHAENDPYVSNDKFVPPDTSWADKELEGVNS
jgi:hypothetical protein